VTAINELGESDLSESTSAAQCEAEAAAPSRNPDNVCSRLQAPKQLVIVWEVTRIHHHHHHHHQHYRHVSSLSFFIIHHFKMMMMPTRIYASCSSVSRKFHGLLYAFILLCNVFFDARHPCF